MKRIPWRDLSDAQKKGVAVLGLVQVGLTLGTLWDLRRRPQREIRGPKGAWTAAAFINFLGPAAYFLFGKKR